MYLTYILIGGDIKMKLRKIFCCIISIIIFLTIILTNSISKPNEEIKKTKVTINYNNKISTEDIEDSNEVRVSTPGSGSEGGIIVLPVPDASKQLILDAL